jgi:hypothetical protein
LPRRAARADEADSPERHGLVPRNRDAKLSDRPRSTACWYDRAEALSVILAWRTPVRGLTPQGSPWKRARPRAEFVDAIERVVEGMHSSLVFWADARALVGRMARI